MPFQGVTTNQIITLIAPTIGTGAPQVYDCSPFESVIIAAPGLATTETVTVGVVTPNGIAPMFALNSGGELTPGLTATLQAGSFPAGQVLSVQKSVTAGAVGVYLMFTRPTY